MEKTRYNQELTPQKRLLEYALMVVYGAILFGNYYLTEMFIFAGGIQLRVRFLLTVVLTGLAVVHFFVFTDVKRGAALALDAWILVLPNLFLLLTSVPVWVDELVTVSVMRRGLIDQLYVIMIITSMAGLLYVFGEKGFQVNLICMLAAYLLKLVPIVASNGVGAFMREFVTLIVTFADETGPIMESAEFHEPTFCMGMMLMGIVLVHLQSGKKKRNWLLWLEFAVGAFCFLTGFKRISVLASAAAILGWMVLSVVTRGGKKHTWIVEFLGVLLVAACFAYIAATKLGFFELLERQFGINTMGRAWLSYLVDPLYDITPDFMGHGTGFISRFMGEGSSTIKALHNGPLQIYIDNGFWGFWLWGLVYLPMRTRHFTKTRGGDAGIAAFCCALAMLITSLTDNTIFYADVAGAIAMIAMYYKMEAISR